MKPPYIFLTMITGLLFAEIRDDNNRKLETIKVIKK